MQKPHRDRQAAWLWCPRAQLLCTLAVSYNMIFKTPGGTLESRHDRMGPCHMAGLLKIAISEVISFRLHIRANNVHLQTSRDAKPESLPSSGTIWPSQSLSELPLAPTTWPSNLSSSPVSTPAPPPTSASCPKYVGGPHSLPFNSPIWAKYHQTQENKILTPLLGVGATAASCLSLHTILGSWSCALIHLAFLLVCSAAAHLSPFIA